MTKITRAPKPQPPDEEIRDLLREILRVLQELRDLTELIHSTPGS